MGYGKVSSSSSEEYDGLEVEMRAGVEVADWEVLEGRWKAEVIVVMCSSVLDPCYLGVQAKCALLWSHGVWMKEVGNGWLAIR